MRKLLSIAPLLVAMACGAPEDVPPFIAIELIDPEGFVSQQADVFEVTNRAIVGGNPIEKVFEVPAPDHALPTTFNIRFSEEVRGTNVDVEVRGLRNGQEVFFASDTVVANTSVITMTTRFCGDEALDAARGEGCDEGAANSDDIADACRTSCQPAGCGDGVIDSGEACDDNNNNNGDGCRSDCTQELCGDGIEDPQEQCDDGDALDNDGCDSDCVPTQITQISAGGGHTCVLFRSRQVKCWGSNASGQLGYGNTENIGDDELPSTVGTVDVGGDVVQISAGNEHTCAVLTNGSLRCWGEGFRRQLGYNNSDDVGDDEEPSIAGDVPIGVGVVQVSAGFQQTCALLEDQTVRCWGLGSGGSLGYPGINLVLDPAAAGGVQLGDNAFFVDTTFEHTCALVENFNQSPKVLCWGVGTGGRLGTGSIDSIGDDEQPSSEPKILSFVRDVSTGISHSCALLLTGNVVCWGNGANGVLGYGNLNNIGDDEFADESNPVPLGGNVADFAVGGLHSCAILSGGSVRCWGAGESGALGYGNTNNIGDDELPQTAGDVNVGGNAILIDSGTTHTCVVLDTQRVRCWGSALGGQLGYGDQITIGDNETPSTAGDVPLF